MRRRGRSVSAQLDQGPSIQARASPRTSSPRTQAAIEARLGRRLVGALRGRPRNPPPRPGRRPAAGCAPWPRRCRAGSRSARAASWIRADRQPRRQGRRRVGGSRRASRSRLSQTGPSSSARSRAAGRAGPPSRPPAPRAPSVRQRVIGQPEGDPLVEPDHLLDIIEQVDKLLAVGLGCLVQDLSLPARIIRRMPGPVREASRDTARRGAVQVSGSRTVRSAAVENCDTTPGIVAFGRVADLGFHDKAAPSSAWQQYPMADKNHILTLSCEDRPRIVATVTGRAGRPRRQYRRKLPVLGSRHQPLLPAHPFHRARGGHAGPIRQALGPASALFGMQLDLTDGDRRPRILIMVSRFDHCFEHLLYQIRVGWLRADVAAVVSNHEDARAPRPTRPASPYHCWPVTKDNKAEQEQRLLRAGRPDGCRAGRAGALHAGPVRPVLDGAVRADHQHPPLVPAELQGRQALPPGV